MSEYCKSKALDSFKDLIYSLKCKYIIVSYNNTYNSKSSSSKNKMTLEEIQDVLEKWGTTHVISKKHKAFNTGSTEFADHREYLFIYYKSWWMLWLDHHSIINIVNKEYITGGFYSLKGLIKQLKQGTN